MVFLPLYKICFYFIIFLFSYRSDILQSEDNIISKEKLTNMEHLNPIKREKKTLPLLAIIAVNFLWGLDFIAIEYMMAYLSPAMFTIRPCPCSTIP